MIITFKIWDYIGFRNLKRKHYSRAIEQGRATWYGIPLDEMMPVSRWFEAENIGRLMNANIERADSSS